MLTCVCVCVETGTEDKWFTNSCGSPIQSKLIAVAVCCPMSEPPFPLITKNVALVCLSCTCMDKSMLN